ncbi:PyrBI operon leader peptide [Klebsiella sp. AS10]|jgi:hypothetical protein
MSCV